MRKSFVILSILLVLAIGFMIFRHQQQENVVAPKIEGEQEQTYRVSSTATETGEPTTSAETPEQVEREISEIIEHLEALHAPEPAEEGEENPPAPADPVAAAWARLEYISQNPQQWGDLSPEATQLMEQLTPTWVLDTGKGEGPAEDAMFLQAQLTEFQDPRSPEIFVNYFREGIWQRQVEEALIAIGPPSIPSLISLLDAKTRLMARWSGAKLLGIIGSEHRQELGGAVEHIILPKLEQIATSDPDGDVRRVASEAIARLR
jgi:hypothetical protein